MRPAHLLTVVEKEYNSTRSGHHTPVMLWGAPGVGKSQMVAQVAKNQNTTLIDIRLSQMEPSDLRGIPFKKGEAVEWAVPAMLPNAKRHGENGILFLDEITSAPPSVSAAAYQLIIPAEAAAPRTTMPVPHRDPGVVPVMVGMAFTTTFVVVALLEQPSTVAVTL